MAPSEPRNSAAQRGTKRKRPAPKQETPGEIIPKKLHHGLHEARKAAKKAAAFELRKLVKRLKQARAQDAGVKPVKGDDPAEMERQLEVLKHAEPEQFANTALKTKILKDKLLSQNDDVQAALADKLSTNLVAPQEPGSAAAKVHSRLLSSKILAEAVHAVVDTLREVLDPLLAKGKAKRAEAADESADEGEDEAEVEVDRRSRGKKARVADESDEEDDEEGSEAEVDDAGWESGTVDGGDDAGWESGTVDGGEGAVAGSSDEDEGEDDEESAEESSDELPKAKTKAKPAPAQDAKSKTKASAGESTFLPSLSVGFTRGDSDASDISDDEADAPRKNRRGQRARRAIWEKKYGKNANHVKKQQEQDPRQQRRDGSRGAGGGGNAKGPGKAQSQARGAPARRGAQKFVAPQQTDSGWGKPVGAGAGANPKTGAPKEDKGLHPSWEAKRKLKEKLNPSIVPAQGKKIKFS
ncbi:Bud-site selection protein [Polyporus arcularius HHB13444]|uniref:Bud-site selection protein n=1 Tax=Polyporus arcularius HHB13444 TaxID=1314778 RepID=A0A5C3PAM9_9APHY|nr:Bud-site selection protein [Polyporus arcularius HHB13444]